MRKLINFEKIANNPHKKDTRRLLDPEWQHILGFKLLDAYFQAKLIMPSILKELLDSMRPSYSFFDYH